MVKHWEAASVLKAFSDARDFLLNCALEVNKEGRAGNKKKNLNEWKNKEQGGTSHPVPLTLPSLNSLLITGTLLSPKLLPTYSNTLPISYASPCLLPSLLLLLFQCTTTLHPFCSQLHPFLPDPADISGNSSSVLATHCSPSPS